MLLDPNDAPDSLARNIEGSDKTGCWNSKKR